MLVQMFAVKEEPGLGIFSDVGLKGNTRYELKNGRAEISGVKFATTSYHHKVSIIKIIGV